MPRFARFLHFAMMGTDRYWCWGQGAQFYKCAFNIICHCPVGGNMDAYDIIGLTFAAGSILLVLMFFL